ncbi:MAG: hypothetical protein GY757_44905 [bacterium]|nr:hypothetical protein [bacterium]
MDPILAVVLILSTAVLLSLGVAFLGVLSNLKSLIVDLEKTSTEARELSNNLRKITEKVDNDLNKVDDILDASKETVTIVSSSLKAINMNIVTKSAGILAFIPAIKLGWNLVRKLKGGKKNV